MEANIPIAIEENNHDGGRDGEPRYVDIDFERKQARARREEAEERCQRRHKGDGEQSEEIHYRYVGARTRERKKRK